MLNFDNIENLVSYMFENLDNENHLVSIIANKEITIEVMKELLNYKNVDLNSCEIDYNADYDKEYLTSLSYNSISEEWYVNIEKCFLPDKREYISTGGYVLFHEDVNSKVMISMQNNEFMPLGDHDWFVVSEAEESVKEGVFESKTMANDSDIKSGQVSDSSITIKMIDVDTDEFRKIFEDIRNDMIKGMMCRPYLFSLPFSRIF